MGGAVPLSREHLEDKEAGAFRAGKRASESGCERSLARAVSVSFLPGEGGSGGGFSDQKGVGGPEASPEGPRLSLKRLPWASSVVEEDAWSSLCPAPSKHTACGLGWPCVFPCRWGLGGLAPRLLWAMFSFEMHFNGVGRAALLSPSPDGRWSRSHHCLCLWWLSPWGRPICATPWGRQGQPTGWVPSLVPSSRPLKALPGSPLCVPSTVSCRCAVLTAFSQPGRRSRPWAPEDVPVS